jgi:hypothetical protein
MLELRLGTGTPGSVLDADTGRLSLAARGWQDERGGDGEDRDAGADPEAVGERVVGG